MRQSSFSGTMCGVCGVLALLSGGWLLFFRSKSLPAFGGKATPASFGGIALVVVGIVLMIFFLYGVYMRERRYQGTRHDKDREKVDDIIEQLSGHQSIYGVFHSEDNSRALSFYRDNTCILKEGTQICRGTMEPMEWASGKPVLWRVTVDIDGCQKICEISKEETNILIRSDKGEEIFYRAA